MVLILVNICYSIDKAVADNFGKESNVNVDKFKELSYGCEVSLDASVGDEQNDRNVDKEEPKIDNVD